MNPSFMAMQKAGFEMLKLMLTGKEHEPKKAKDKETSINGRAFAPGHGVQQEVSSEEKEAKVRAHLDKLAGEAKARYLERCFSYPTIYEVSTKVDENSTKEEALNALHKAHASYTERHAEPSVNALGMTRAELSDTVKGARDAHIAKIKCPTIGEIAAERHKSHQAYIDRQIALNRTTLIEPPVEGPVEPKYPTSDLIDLLHEHIAEVEEQERREAAANAVIHTGEGMNLEDHNANKGVPWHQQG